MKLVGVDGLDVSSMVLVAERRRKKERRAERTSARSRDAFQRREGRGGGDELVGELVVEEDGLG